MIATLYFKPAKAMLATAAGAVGLWAVLGRSAKAVKVYMGFYPAVRFVVMMLEPSTVEKSLSP